MSSAKLEHKGYNRGLILGLTMAESMILLVFCLLLVAAAIILAEREKRQAAEVQVAELREQLAEIRRDRDDLGRRLALVANPSDRAAVEEEWRELVSAREARLQMGQAGHRGGGACRSGKGARTAARRRLRPAVRRQADGAPRRAATAAAGESR